MLQCTYLLLVFSVLPESFLTLHTLFHSHPISSGPFILLPSFLCLLPLYLLQLSVLFCLSSHLPLSLLLWFCLY